MRLAVALASSALVACLGRVDSGTVESQSAAPPESGPSSENATVAKLPGNFNAATEDADAVYVATERGLLYRVDKKTMANEVVATIPAHDVFGLAVDDTDVYYTATALSPMNVGGVFRVAKRGGTPAPVASGGRVGALAVDADAVYWSDYTSASLMRLSKGGGDPVALASDHIMSDLALDAAHVVWGGYDSPFYIVNHVRRVAKTGGVPETLLAPGPDVYKLGLVGTTPYWTVATGGIQTLGATGEVTTLVSSMTPMDGFAVDASGVYFGVADTTGSPLDIPNPDAHGGEVLYVPLSGGPPTIFASASPPEPPPVAWDGTVAIFTDPCNVFSIEATTSAGNAVCIVRRVPKRPLAAPPPAAAAPSCD